MLNRYFSIRNNIFLCGESLLIVSSLFLVNWLFKGTPIWLLELPEYVRQALVVTIVFQTSLYFFDLYELRNDLSLPETATKITQAFGVGCIVLGALYFFVPEVLIPTKIFWTSYFLMYCLILVWRACYYYILKQKLFVQSVVMVGSGQLAADITREIEGRYDSPYKIIAFVGEKEPLGYDGKEQLFKSLSEITTITNEDQIDQIVVALDDRRGTMPIETLLKYKLKGVNILQGINFYERLTGKILVENVNPSWIIFSEGFSATKFQSFAKRSFDIFVSSILLILVFPVMLITAMIIKLESPGSVFYCQKRVGKGRRNFQVYKFRSMIQDAEENGAVWAQVNDSRVTRFGNFIRRTRIDELPQLINVLKGEMSLVGPRPERPMFVEKLNTIIPFYDIRHDIRPGVTGWAQVCYPYGASEEDALRKLEHDLYYMKNISFSLDVLIALKTIKTVLFAKGGR